MRLHADFGQRVLVHADALPWQGSPIAGVDRRPLDRIGGEVARATSFVRYAPGSAFSAHVHGGGEEFLVLDGVFQDEHGDFPAGSYIRNPPTSRHTPGSAPGCVIFVKLWQFDPADRIHIRTHLDRLTPIPHAGRPGVAVAPLFYDGQEDVRLEVIGPGRETRLEALGGAEVLVLRGGLRADGATLRPLSWLRLPPGDTARLAAGPDGARLWVKTGHLLNVRAPDA